MVGRFIWKRIGRGRGFPDFPEIAMSELKGNGVGERRLLLGGPEFLLYDEVMLRICCVIILAFKPMPSKGFFLVVKSGMRIVTGNKFVLQ